MKFIAKQLALFSVLSSLVPSAYANDAIGIGVLGPVTPGPVKTGVPRASKTASRQPAAKPVKAQPAKVQKPLANPAPAVAKPPATPALPPKPPQEEIKNMSKLTLAPGVVLKRHRGALNINVLDVDLKNADVQIKPVLASESFNKLHAVKDQAAKVNAIAAVNANYFKYDGTPLGTLVLDGEWIAGPIFDRISMGITSGGDVFIDKINLHGILETSNPAAPKIWVNTINQPRRTGSRLILYTRRWGDTVKIPYAGTLVAVDSQGRVVDKSLQVMHVPFNGYVLSDLKDSDIAKLKVGDIVNLRWNPSPQKWKDVIHAISGGPCLIRDGNLFVDLKGEHFRKSWTSDTITARTAAGVTKDKRLILVTVEGRHSLWDLAKMLKELGCVDAMNLDGGGSTTMVVRGDILTRNANSAQRRVATTLAVVPRINKGLDVVTARKAPEPSPDIDLTNLDASPRVAQEANLADPAVNKLTNETIELMNPATASGLPPDTIELTSATVSPAASPTETKTGPKARKEKFLKWMRHFMP